MKILVSDTETTGLSKEKTVTKDNYHLWPSIVQLSFLVYDTQTSTIPLVYDSIIKVNETVIISPESIKFHNITKEKSLEEGSEIETVLLLLLNFICSSDKIVGHNIKFDINMIKAEIYRIMNKYSEQEDIYKQYSMFLEKISTFEDITCTMHSNIDRCNIKRTNKRGDYLKYPTLEELHIELFHKKPNNLHNSLNDILITLRCFIMTTENTDICKLENIAPFYIELI